MWACAVMLLPAVRTLAQSGPADWESPRPAVAEESWQPIDPFVGRRPLPLTTEPAPLGPEGDQPLFDASPAELQDVQYPLEDDTFLGIPPEAPVLNNTAPAWTPPLISTPELPPPASGVFLDGGQVDLIVMAPPDDQLGAVSIDLRTSIGFHRWRGFTIRPRFAAHFLQGPSTTDLPPRLYDLMVEARMYWPLGDRWLTEFAITPGMFTDFRNTSSEAVRVMGRALAFYRWSPDLQLVFGALYLDREDIVALPAVGLVWTPDPDLRLELMAPRPRIAVRYGGDHQHERWAYLAGEFGGLGGGSFAIQREDTGLDDVVTYRDYRVLMGVEFKFKDGSGWRVEGGYLFGRSLEYLSGIGDQDLSDTLMLRSAISF